MARTVAFFPESAYGPTNNCIGIADVLRRRGWRVVFIAEESFTGTFVEKGFEERLMRLGPPSGDDEDPGQFWKDFIRETAPVFRRPTIEQLEGFVVPTFQALIDGARYVDERLVEIIDEVRPDVIVEDNVVSFPALAGERPSLGPDRLLQPRRDQGPRRSAGLLRLSGRRPLRLGGVPGRVRARDRPAPRRLRRVLPRARSAAVARGRADPRVSRPQPLALSGRGRLRADSSRSATAGTTSRAASAGPTPTGSCPITWPARKAR